MRKLNDAVLIDEEFDSGKPFESLELIFVPDEYVDGIHTRNVMLKKDFPIKILVRSTGQTYEVHGFEKGGMIYTSKFSEGGVVFSNRGTYFGKLGVDFYFI